MSEQILTRLRTLGSLPGTEPISADLDVHATLHEAADEILRLSAEASRMKLALENIRAYASGREPVPALTASKEIFRNIGFALCGRLSQIERLARDTLTS